MNLLIDQDHDSEREHNAPLAVGCDVCFWGCVRSAPRHAMDDFSNRVEEARRKLPLQMLMQQRGKGAHHSPGSPKRRT